MPNSDVYANLFDSMVDLTVKVQKGRKRANMACVKLAGVNDMQYTKASPKKKNWVPKITCNALTGRGLSESKKHSEL
jgi:hypothetical protein